MGNGTYWAFHARFHPRTTSSVQAEIQFVVLKLNQDRGVSWTRGCTVVQPHSDRVQVCNASELGKLDDCDEHVSGSLNKDDDVLGHAANWG